jgi:hypothetical protein
MERFAMKTPDDGEEGQTCGAWTEPGGSFRQGVGTDIRFPTAIGILDRQAPGYAPLIGESNRLL